MHLLLFEKQMFQACVSANFKKKIHIIYILWCGGFCFFDGGMCVVFLVCFGLVGFLVLFFFLLPLASRFPPTFARLFANRGSLL